MNKSQKEILSRILFGILILTVISILIIPKPNKNASNSIVPTEKPVILTQTVILTANGFQPKEITVKKGTYVTWTNNSGKKASVNSADHPTHKLYPFLNLGVFENGTNLQAKIDKIGTFQYHNHFSPTQTGTITVIE